MDAMNFAMWVKIISDKFVSGVAQNANLTKKLRYSFSRIIFIYIQNKLDMILNVKVNISKIF